MKVKNKQQPAGGQMMAAGIKTYAQGGAVGAGLPN